MAKASTAPRKARRSVAAARQRRVIQTYATDSYQRGRAAVVLGIFALFFGFLWMANGNFTALFVIGLGGTVELGWAVHLLLTAIEIAPVVLVPFLTGVPRRVAGFLWLLSLPFGVFDVYSSAVGVAPYFAWIGTTATMAHLQNTLLGEAIAFLPEPMLVWLLVALRSVIRGK